MTGKRENTVQAALLTDGSGRALDLPPVAASLRPKQIAFARFVAGGFSYRASAELAGYQYNSEASARNHGSELAADARIAELIRVFTQALIKSAAPAALGTLTKIMTDEKAKDGDRIKAAKGVLDKSQPTRTAHQIEGDIQIEHRHVEGFEPSIIDLYRRAGREPPAHLLERPQVVDAEFEDVTPDADAEEVWSA